MSQQINLLNPELRPKVELLTLNHVALASSLVLMLVLLMAGWGRQREGVELHRLGAQEQLMRVAQEQLSQLGAMQASRRISPALERQLAERKAVLESKREVLAALESGDLGQQDGFSGYLGAFARRVPEGLWLTGFDLQEGGQQVLLQGRMRTEPLLPQFIQQMDQEPLLKGRTFAALELNQVLPDPAAPTAVPPHWSFTLGGQLSRERR